MTAIASAVDPDADTVTYTWSATAGAFTMTEGDSVVWIAPDVEAIENETIAVEATDEHGAATWVGIGITVVPEGGVWMVKSPMPTARWGLAIAEVNGKIYAIGGFVVQDSLHYHSATVEEYDPETDTWRQKAPMPTPRSDLTAAAVNGKVYALGGHNGTGDLSANEEYDPVTDTWTTKTAMPTPRAAFAVAVANGKVYAIGGLSANEEYDPIADSWTVRAPLPTPRGALTAASYNNRIYVIGGGAFPEFSATNEVYDPITNTWEEKAPMLTPRDGLAAAVLHGKIYAIGGRNFYPNTAIGTNEAYDPVTDTWEIRTPMPSPRDFFGVAAVKDNIYAIGGCPCLDATDANEMYYSP